MRGRTRAASAAPLRPHPSLSSPCASRTPSREGLASGAHCRHAPDPAHLDAAGVHDQSEPRSPSIGICRLGFQGALALDRGCGWDRKRGANLGEHSSRSPPLGVCSAAPAPRQRLDSVPPAWHGEETATRGYETERAAGKPRFRPLDDPSRWTIHPCGLIGNASKMPWKETGPVADRKRFIEDSSAGRRRDLAWLGRACGISRETERMWVRRFPADGYPRSLAGC